MNKDKKNVKKYNTTDIKKTGIELNVTCVLHTN